MWSWGANKKGQLGIGKTGGNCSTPQQGWCNIFACDIFQVLKHHEISLQRVYISTVVLIVLQTCI